MRALLLAGAGISLLLPAAAVAQARPSLDLFLLQNDALAGSTPLWGAGFTTGGAIGVRVGGALAFGSTWDAYGGEGTGVSAFGADADLVLSLGALMRDSRGRRGGTTGAAPYAFAGIGMVGRRAAPVAWDDAWADEDWERGMTASFGGGVSLPLGNVLALDGSARWRVPVADSSRWAVGYPRGWEYRIGLQLNLGGGSGDRRSTSRPSSRTGSRSSSGGGVRASGLPFPTLPGAGTSAAARRVLDTADDYLGVRYVWGGETPRGFDCSGYTQYVFRRHGIELPRVSRQQARVGDAVVPSLGSLRAGDLLFFAADYRTVDHVAIYVGDGQMIHATASGGEVRYDDLRSQRGQWFADHMIGARRVIGAGDADWVRALGLVGAIVKEFDRGDGAPRP